MATITDTISLIKSKSGNRPQYAAQNKGDNPVKLTFNPVGTFADDDGLTLEPGEGYVYTDEMAEVALYGISDTGQSNRVLIADPSIV
jgi:hypothetical protein